MRTPTTKQRRSPPATERDPSTRPWPSTRGARSCRHSWVHLIGLDGVYVRSPDSDELVFHALAAPSAEEITDVAARRAQRVRKIVRPAAEADAEAIVALVAREIREGVAHFGTAPPARDEIVAEIASAYPFVVADDGGFLGFARASAWKARGAYAWTAEVGVYVTHGRYRRGVGRALVEDLLERMGAAGFRTVLAGIALPNPGSVGLFEKLGFTHAGTLPAVGFKHGAWRDVGYWTKDLGAGAPGPTPV